jgi:hypothetical protein
LLNPYHIFEVSCLFGKHVMTTGEPSYNSQYFLELQKQGSKKRMNLFKEKKHLNPHTSNFISSSFLICFEQFKKLWKCHLKLYKTCLKCKDNRMMSKDFKLQNANWSYVPTHMPVTPFIWRRHILLIPSLIWATSLHWMCLFNLYNFFLKCKDNRVMSKDLNFHIANWSYVPTHMPMTPFIWRRQILIIS